MLDLFAVPDDVRSVGGGQGRSVVAGDLVLSPGRDPQQAEWLCPVLARLAVTIDDRPRRRARDLRVALPVPARDGSWVVDGWGATRHEPGTTPCRDLDVLVAAGRVLHAELAVVVPSRPEALDRRSDRWAVAERQAFGPPVEAVGAADARGDAGLSGLVRQLVVEGPPGGPDQLVHGDLAGNVLLGPGGAPLVVDVAPYWRPVLWAEAVCVLDAALRTGSEPAEAWTTGDRRDAMARAALFRLLSDDPPAVDRYRSVLSVLL